MTETVSFILVFIVLSLLVAAADIVRKKFNVNAKSTRMFLHAGVAAVVFFAPLLFQSKLYPALLAAVFIVVNFVSVKLGMFQGMNVDKKNLGTVYYPISFFILVMLLWDNYPLVVSTAMLVMGLADPAAAIVGSALKNTHEVFAFGERKTFEGSAAMFAVASAAVLIGALFFRQSSVAISDLPIETLFNIAVSIGLMVAAVELVSPKATDNLTVPLSAAVLIYISASNQMLFDAFMVGEFLAAIVAVVSYKLKLLTKDGAVATFILGGFIFGFGGWKWSTPILAFFIIGSLASKLFSKRKVSYNLLYEKSHTRDSAQAFANGGFALLMLICNVLSPNYHWFLAYLGALTAVTADTLATEIGVFSRTNPFSLSLWKRVEKGVSGAISPLGTIAGLISAAVLAVLTLPFAGGYAAFPIRFVAAGAFSGALGSLADSLLGGTFQSQYQCATCGKITERKKHCKGQETTLVQGYRWMNNDVVNFAASIVGAVAFPLLFLLIPTTSTSTSFLSHSNYPY